jgi:hypothetical protein
MMPIDKGQYGLGRVFKRGKIWWVKYHRDGRPYRESSKSSRKRDAVALLKQRLTEIGTGTFVAPSRDKFRFADAVDLMRADYRNRGRKSWSRAQQSIRHLEQVFAGDQLAHITTERVDR